MKIERGRMDGPTSILAVCGHLPKPDRSGGGLRTFGFLALLAKSRRVAVCPYLARPGAEEAARYASIYRDAGIEVLPAAWEMGLERALSARAYDAVLFEFWNWAERGIGAVRRLQPWAKVVIETVDIHFLREEASLALGMGELASVEANKQAELAAYRGADALICISEDDAKGLEGRGELGRRFVIPHMAAPRDRVEASRGAEILFIGGFDHAPNADGLIWFVREAWPLVRASLPEARLVVVGSNPTAEVIGLGGIAGIEVVGWVPDVTPHYDRAALLIGPIRFGAGVKIKVVESMARGLPVVTTTVGAQGLAVASGEHLLIADSPEEFAGRIVELVLEPGRAARIGRAARDFIIANCSPEATAARLDSMLGAVVDRGRPAIPPLGWVAKMATSRTRQAFSNWRRGGALVG